MFYLIISKNIQGVWMCRQPNKTLVGTIDRVNFMEEESAYNEGDPSLIPVLGRSPGGRHGNPLQYSCLENPHGQRSLVGYSPWGHKESDMTE